MNLETINGVAEKGKKIILDFGYNIVATMVVTIVLQLVVYPFLATFFSKETYGLLLTIMGIANIFVVSFGGGLNNVRLIHGSIYEEKKITGDFNILLLFSVSIGTIIFDIIVATQFKIDGVSLLFLSLYVLVGVVINYWTVSYRIIINYKSNLFYNVVLSIGYLIGIVVTKKTENWTIVFVLGEVLGLFFLLKTTFLYREKITVSELFPKTMKAFLVLVGTNCIANIVTYLDRIFLYPMLGGEQVTIYTVSSFVGKSVGLLITPIAGVLLSYYSQKSFKMTVKKYWTVNGITLFAGTLMGIIAVVIAPWITGVLYPTVIYEARDYLVIANVASIIGAITNIVSPSVLKFANIFWQIVVQIIYAMVYIGFGYIGMVYCGLQGFCIATLLVNLFRMLLLMIIGHISILKGEKA